MANLEARTFQLLVPPGVEGQIADKRERRYLVTTAQAQTIAQALKGSEDKQHPQYRVSTTYLSKAGIAYRIRQYGTETNLRMECKQRIGGRVLKAKFDTPHPVKANYEGSISYHRSAYSTQGVRVTIDQDIQSVGRTFPKCVVEVKGESIPKRLEGLLPKEDLRFGKRAWVLGEL
jgi:hypothetical protein